MEILGQSETGQRRDRQQSRDRHRRRQHNLSGRLTAVRDHDLEALSEEAIETADRISVGLGLISAIPA
ncbi:hypothetical protein [Humibacter sp.]|jgi:hypothetical protein|uniref:hypothetical protein n=1 Tax=Humibacter sp. TaxID=1940291 RepID=UPI002C57E7E7|nr:hypothetical protein [Humibacter sp.]HVX08049.1 hypothetical protein [Humibacter sp.]